MAASGDLRNVILSVNSLPLDYSGKLNILLNDRIPHIVVRNLVLLIILGQTTDLNKSVDIALHAWYSAFLPMDYLIHVMITATNFITAQAPSEPFEVKIGPRSAIKGFLSSEGSACLASMITSQYTVADVNSELNRVMCAHSDYLGDGMLNVFLQVCPSTTGLVAPPLLRGRTYPSTGLA
jgi:hypothetical protein